MPLFVLSVAPTPDKKRTDWYFDSEREFLLARQRAIAVDPYVVWRNDYISDAAEFNAWLDKEPQCASD